MRVVTLFLTLLGSSLYFSVGAQFAPQATIGGSTAINKTSAQFVAWASGCSVQRGLMQINDPALGYVSGGDSGQATGMPDGGIVSLGDNGVAVLTFARPITDGPGPDFAVFENGFPNIANAEEAFLELAFVEVSSDGSHFVRFSAVSNIQDTAQHSSVAGSMYMNARQLHNLAGKYIGTWGTPFDLAELAGTPGLDVNRITHVRIVDVIGSLGAAGTLDANGRKINDPFPTPFPIGGFDLDAVGVIHAAPLSVYTRETVNGVRLFPNPAGNDLTVALPAEWGSAELSVLDMSGRRLIHTVTATERTMLQITNLAPGTYFITIRAQNGASCIKPFVHR